MKSDLLLLPCAFQLLLEHTSVFESLMSVPNLIFTFLFPIDQ